MIPVDKFRDLLGEEADGLTNKQIEEIRDLEYRIADAVFDLWLRERNSYPPPTPAIAP